MSWFKRKSRLKFRNCSLFSVRKNLTEREYVDENFEDLKTEIKNLKREIELLKTFIPKGYLLIEPYNDTVIDGEWWDACAARNLAREDNYNYIKSIEGLGELWVKEEKNETV